MGLRKSSAQKGADRAMAAAGADRARAAVRAGSAVAAVRGVGAEGAEGANGVVRRVGAVGRQKHPYRTRPPAPAALAALAAVALVGVCLALCVPAAEGALKENPEWTKMVQALAKKKNYVQFLTRLQTANSLARLSQRSFYAGYITIFAPTDAVFAKYPRYNYLWNSRRCARPSQPQACYVPLIQYMMYQGKLSLPVLKAAKNRKVWNSWNGDGMMKFKGPGKYGFFLGPEVGCGRFCASKVSGGYLDKPNVFVGSRILVHSINALLAPASVWPGGFK